MIQRRWKAIYVALGMALVCGMVSGCWLFDKKKICGLADLLMTVAKAVSSASGQAQNFNMHEGVYSSAMVLAAADIKEGRGVPVDLIMAVGDSLKLTGTEANNGNGSAGPHDIGVTKVAIAAGGTDSVLAKLAVNQLLPKDSATRAATLKAVSTGVTVIQMVANYANRVAECDTTNNRKQVDITGVSSDVTTNSVRGRYVVIRVVPSGSAMSSFSRNSHPMPATSSESPAGFVVVK